MSGPIKGVKVLDLSMIIAGGTASSLLADFGAEVIKVEKPGAGDPLRNWGPFLDEESIWWKVHSRNKKSITLNLQSEAGQAILKKLVKQVDILIEGFRPGTLEKWGIGPEELHDSNPKLVILRYSGFGQTGPYKNRPGFGTIAECMSGYVNMSGFPDGPPNLPPLPLADLVSGVFGAMSGMMALYNRDITGTSTKGQIIDLSLYEPLMRLMIPYVTMFNELGINRSRVGNDFPDAAPRNLYQAGDQKWVGLSATSQNTWESLVKAMGLDKLLTDQLYHSNESRIKNSDSLNNEMQEWFKDKTAKEVLDTLIPSGGIVGQVYDHEDISRDKHIAARENIIEVNDHISGSTKMIGVIPKFDQTPGEITNSGPRLGEHNDEIFSEWLEFGPEEIEILKSTGDI
jgi:crotonobetainyl-CoA:carnitine CoA-transferase CaiB-like acyl-CoA transferase